MSLPDHIPILFTLPPSNRHEIILLSTASPSLKALNKQITATIASSPNCSEFMSKYKPADSASGETIQEIKVHWAESGRDRKIWPEYTVVTEDNWAAVLEVMARTGLGRDVLEIKVGKGE